MSYDIMGRIDAMGGSLYVQLAPTKIAVLDTTAMRLGEIDALYLNRVNVPNDYQNRGVGSALIEELKASARHSGHKFVIVEPGGYDPDRQEDRIRWYERHGFIKQDEGYYLLAL